MTPRSLCLVLVGTLLLVMPASTQQQTGSIRGVVLDQDFGAPLPNAKVLVLENGRSAQTTGQGNYVIPELAPGTYTLVFSKDGYVQLVRADVVVAGGQLTDVDVELAGEFVEMAEFVVQDIQLDAGSEAALLELRFDSPALMDSVSAELISRAGASDAASALTLVSGATIQDGKFAVVRGLPDRYVNSQMNSVRLPTADEDKRAVELDQFPAAVIDSIQVSKTFTPDQQGDASGGAVNVVLTRIPEETTFQFSSQLSWNSQAAGESEFLSYDGGGLDFWGVSKNDPQPNMTDWAGPVGASETDAPVDSKWSLAGGGRTELDSGWEFGGFASLFYERDSSFYDDGVNDALWATSPGAPLSPEFSQGSPDEGEFFTSLFDVKQGVEQRQWGGLGTVGLENENHTFGLTYLYTRTTEDRTTVATDTRGKAYYFDQPGQPYSPDDPFGFGNLDEQVDEAPYLRTDTIEYTERTTRTLQFDAQHRDLGSDYEIGSWRFLPAQLDWRVSTSKADFYQPDKRLFGAYWYPESFDEGVPIFGIPDEINPPVWGQLKPDANFTLGNLQRTFKELEEESDQYAIDLELPFEQWGGEEGYLKFGLFDDAVERAFDQDTFSNFNENSEEFFGDFDEPWSSAWEDEFHQISDGPPLVDVDYDGEQNISAWYGMIDLPLTSRLKLVTGARFESTEISVVNTAEPDALWFPPGAIVAQSDFENANVDFRQDDVLPVVGLEYRPTDALTLRASYTETVARQTFKELTPILQQEFLGGPVFVGNPELQMSAVDNYDLRADYVPYDGALLSASWFRKDVEDPIENIQRLIDFSFTTPVNYPEGVIEGIELEVRQDLGHFWDSFEGVAVGANATFIDSEVQLPQDEIDNFANDPNIQQDITSRDMTNAPEHLYNFYLTYDIESTGTQAALFYTVRGDTLVAGASELKSNFVPDIYEKEYGTLNFSLSQEVGERGVVKFQAKNLTNPDIEQVYRGGIAGGDVTRQSFSRGREFSISYTLRF